MSESLLSRRMRERYRHQERWHVPVAILEGRSRIDYRHLALIREYREREPVLADVVTAVPSCVVRAPEGRWRSSPVRTLSLAALLGLALRLTSRRP